MESGWIYLNKKSVSYNGLKLNKRFIYECDELKRIEIQEYSESPMIDDVYTGQVVNYSQAMNAYFVDFNCYSGLMKSARKYKMGETVSIVVVKEARDGKGYRISDLIYFKGKNVIYFPEDTKNRSSLKLSGDKVGMLRKEFSDFKGFLFRTACEEASIDEIRAEMETLTKAFDETLRLVGIKQIGKRTHRLMDEIEKIDNLSDILELEDELEKHHQSEMVFFNQTRATFENTRLGTFIDMDSYRYKDTGKDDHLKINMEMLPEILKEIEIRGLSGILLIDLISLEKQEDYDRLINGLIETLKDYKGIKYHDITKLGILELTRQVTRRSIMSFKADELLLEKLFLRLEYFKKHTDVKGIEITLNARYYSSQNLFEELKKTFDFPIKFIYNLNVEDYSVKLVNHIDDSEGI